jgi:hypothetical protein
VITSPAIANPLRSPVTGTVRVYVVPCEPLDSHQTGELHSVMGRFLDALGLGLFPGTLQAVHPVTRGDDGKVDAFFDVTELDPGALRVLYGMLTDFSLTVAPLGTIMAWCGPVGTTPNLFDTDAPMPEYRGGFPFDATITFSDTGSAFPLIVDVVFDRELDAEERHRFEREIRAWAALVHGGYPERGELPGTSTIGPFTVRYEDPRTLCLTVETLQAGAECLEPLKALVVRWSTSVPVEELVVVWEE